MRYVLPFYNIFNIFTETSPFHVISLHVLTITVKTMEN